MIGAAGGPGLDVCVVPMRSMNGAPVASAKELLLGRDEELATLYTLVDGIDERGGALLVRGDAGIGKSALLEVAKDEALHRGLAVVSTTGTVSEARLAFAGLHQLLLPLLGGLDLLPDPQRQALEAAFGIAHGDAPDLFLIGLATLGLIAESAAETPLLFVVDDAHWLDQPSSEVLQFVARRIESDPAVLLFAVREGVPSSFDTADLSELRLVGLHEGASRALLDRVAASLPDDLKHRILDDAAGNPLALIELPVAWGNQGGDVLHEELPLPERLTQAFATRVALLPATTKTLLLIAALNDSASIAETLRAGATLCEPQPNATDLVPAEEARLIALDDVGVRFSHPLVRSAICHAADVAERIRCHAALAQALGEHADRSVWHRAAASLGPDDGIARELDDAAARARRRGGLSVAVAALERGATLSQGASARGARLIKAAELEHELGRMDRATELLGRVETGQLDELQQGRFMWLREYIRETHATATVAESIALSARALAAGDSELALNAIYNASLKAFWFNARPDDREAIVTALESLPIGAHEPRLLAGLSMADPVHRGAFVIERLRRIDVQAFSDPEDLRLLGVALVVIPEYDLAGRFLAAAVDSSRDRGSLLILARALGSQAHAALFRGDFALAERAAEEGLRLSRETHQPRWECSCETFLGHLRGVRGDTQAAETHISRGERLLVTPRSTPGLQHFQLARGATSLAAGQPDLAFEEIRRVFDPVDPSYNPLVGIPGLIDLADAAAATDRLASARCLVEEVRPLVQATGSPCLQTQIRYADAVLADHADAEPLYEAAFRDLAPHARWAQARLRLAYGSWLRRRRRSVDARSSLRIALDEFEGLGVSPWADRAQHELRATGERARRRLPETRDELTAQERHIAHLTAEGLTNREIGKRLFLSHRTVGGHLYRIFPKLGITSRSELAQVVLFDAASRLGDPGQDAG